MADGRWQKGRISIEAFPESLGRGAAALRPYIFNLEMSEVSSLTQINQTLLQNVNRSKILTNDE
jgi:hypothetical protein